MEQQKLIELRREREREKEKKLAAMSNEVSFKTKLGRYQLYYINGYVINGYIINGYITVQVRVYSTHYSSPNLLRETNNSFPGEWSVSGCGL